MSKEPLDDLIFLQLLKELIEKVKEYEYLLRTHPGYWYLRNMLESTIKSLQS